MTVFLVQARTLTNCFLHSVIAEVILYIHRSWTDTLILYLD